MPRRSIWKGSFFDAMTRMISYVWMRFTLLYIDSTIFKIIIYFCLGVTLNMIFFMEFAECAGGSSSDSGVTSAPPQPSANWVLLDHFLSLPNQSAAWVATVRQCLSEARPEALEATVQAFLRIENCAYASRMVEYEFSLIYNLYHAPLNPDIIKAGVKEMLVRHQINEIDSLNSVLASLQSAQDQSPFFRLTCSESEILNEARQTQLCETADAARRELFDQVIALEQAAVERRLEALIEQNHALFREMVATAEIRRPPNR